MRQLGVSYCNGHRQRAVLFNSLEFYSKSTLGSKCWRSLKTFYRSAQIDFKISLITVCTRLANAVSRLRDQ